MTVNLTTREWENLRLFIDPQFTRLRDALKVKEKELKTKAEEISRTQLLRSLRRGNDIIFEIKGLGNKFSTIATDCVRVRQDTT